MKKITAMLLVLVMVFALCACGGQKGPNGTFKLTGLEMNGEDYSEYLSMLGYDQYSITFNSNGTGTLDAGGSSISFTWDSSNLDDGTDKIPYTFSGNSVSIETSGVKMTFTK